MRRATWGALAALGAGIMLWVGVFAYSEIARSQGEVWGSLDDPGAVLGFTSLWVMGISFVLVIGLVAAQVIQDVVRRLAVRTRSAHD